MKNIIIYALIILSGFFAFTSCEDDIDVFNTCLENIEYTDIEVSFNEYVGFDDWSSSGAALVSAIDTVNNVALVTALKFDLPLFSQYFYPDCNPYKTTTSYDWGQLNSITTEIASDYPFISDFLTNTPGIRTMDNNITAFLIFDETELTEKQIFVAIDGEVKLTRTDGGDILESNLGLGFVQVSSANEDAEIIEGLYYWLDGFYFQWDTDNQPD